MSKGAVPTRVSDDLSVRSHAKENVHAAQRYVNQESAPSTALTEQNVRVAKDTEDDKKRAERREQARRLKAARERWGIPTAAEAARIHRFPSITTYQQHENGTRPITKDAARRYAQTFGVDEEWLLWGKNPPFWETPETSPPKEPTSESHFLSEWREHRGMSRDRLADELRVPVDALAKWEAGRVELSDKWLRRIASILETTPGAILDIDPGAVAPSVLEIWFEATQRQRETRRQIVAIRRTGTEN